MERLHGKDSTGSSSTPPAANTHASTAHAGAQGGPNREFGNIPLSWMAGALFSAAVLLYLGRASVRRREDRSD